MNTSINYLPFYAAASERTLRQFIESFWLEGALQGHLERQKDNTAILYLAGLDVEKNRVEYHIAATVPGTFNRVRLQGALQDSRHAQATHNIAEVAGNLLRHLDVAQDKVERFVSELKHTAIKQACSMAVRRAGVLDLPYAVQEAQWGDGHLYHPCFRSRIGFSLDDHQLYGPEFAKPFSLVWLAVAKEVSDIHALNGWEYTKFLRQTISADESGKLYQAIQEQGYDNADFFLLPTHPWHWAHRLQIHYAHWLAEGKLLYLGQGSSQWLAQQSIRSLSSLMPDARFNIKLPLGIANSSADRILSDHHVHNAPLITQWLEEICQQDSYLQQARFAILAEPIGITVKPGVTARDSYGLLGAIWRSAPESILQAGEHVFPCTALTTQDERQQLEITPWLTRHGTQNWVHALLKSMLPPLLHLMVRHGVLLEAHAQNTLLILREGLPVGIAIRDLPGGLHYIVGHTTSEARLSQLRQAPAYRNATNASNGFAMHSISEARDYMLEVLLFIHLSELAYRLERWHGFAEKRFWQMAAQSVLDYQEQVPELAAQLAQFDLFAAHIQIERLATRRLSAAAIQQFHAVPNPLAAFQHHQQYSQLNGAGQ